MPDRFATTAPYHPVFRSVSLPLIVAAGLLLLALGGMLAITDRSLNRITPLRDHHVVISGLQDQLLEIQYLSEQARLPPYRVEPAVFATLAGKLGRLAASPDVLSAEARRDLEEARLLFGADESPPLETLRQGAQRLQQALLEENRQQINLLQDIRTQARLERDLAALALVSIPLSAVFLLYLLRRRFLWPLRNLSVLLARLGEHDFRQAAIADVDPVLEPLIDNYNRMAARLAQLEDEHRQRQDALEIEVRVATRELLAANRSLADADRLAAVGEMAASVAHELRNPLAGIQMALANLQHEPLEADIHARLQSVIDELRRVDGLLNGLLDHARLKPEAPAPVDMRKVAEDLLALVRYQSGGCIRFDLDIPGTLICTLPENRLRQALLNLLLNATQAVVQAHADGVGHVCLSAERGDGQLRLCVRDDGPGFPDAMLRQGPRPFASQRPGGHGLGLASVLRLARDLGGSLQLDNPADGGGQVCLSLPCAAVSPEPD